MASRNGYKIQWISAAHSVATSSVNAETSQHVIESNSASFSEDSNTDCFEVVSPSPKKTRRCSHDNVSIDNFDLASPSILCYGSTSESDDSNDDFESGLRADLIEWIPN